MVLMILLFINPISIYSEIKIHMHCFKLFDGRLGLFVVVVGDVMKLLTLYGFLIEIK
jgi:hypothetical protein